MKVSKYSSHLKCNELEIYSTQYKKKRLNKKLCVSWLVCFCWMGRDPQSENFLGQFPVRHIDAYVVGSVPGWGMYERQPIDISLSRWRFFPSLSLSLPLALKKYK